MQALEAAVPGLTEKLVVVQQGRAFSNEIARLQATGTSVMTLGDGDYPPACRAPRCARLSIPRARPLTTVKPYCVSSALRRWATS